MRSWALKGRQILFTARRYRTRRTRAAKRKEKIDEYRNLFSNPYIAASRGYVDAVIYPRETRMTLIKALETVINKRETRPPKKHGNIPL